MMAIKSVEDNIVSKLTADITDTDTQLTVKSMKDDEGNNPTIPQEGYLLLGNTSDLQPTLDPPPRAEIAKYTDYTINGDDTVQFGDSIYAPLTRGVGNTLARSWDKNTSVGLAISAELFNLLFDAIEPIDGGTFDFKNIDLASELSQGWHKAGESGVVGAGNAGNLITTNLNDGQTLSISMASMIKTDGQPAPSGIDLIIATLDNTGGGTSQVTVLSGDGTTVYDRETGNPLASYTNSTGSAQTVMIAVDNGNWNTGVGSDTAIYASAVAKRG